jgi:ketosteroid isomerase-like protein
MADRDHTAFVSFLAPDAIFFAPGGLALRGAAHVAKGWKPFFEKERPPFSWEPEQVEVLASGLLAIPSGPVRDPAGKRVATFNSVWRREAGGRWLVVLDKGCEGCPCAP